MRLPNLLLTGAVLVALVPASSGAVQSYKVKKGDTLSAVARRLHVSVEALKDANAMDSDSLRPGQKLKVPSKKAEKAKKGGEEPRQASRSKDKGADQGEGQDGARRYTVKRGDTLSGIARSHRLSVKELQALNGLKKRSTLKPGMELLLARGEEIRAERRGQRVREEKYAVRRGDNLWKVARRFHLTTSELKSLNGLRSEALKPGQKLVVARRVEALVPEIAAEAVGECKVEDAKVDAELLDAAQALAEEGEPAGVTDKVIRVAKRMLGIPYRFGGNSSRGIDCSAYVQKVFRFLNMPLPRTAREQYEVGNEVGRDELATGDLVFFRTYARYPSHVGIYLGDNQFIHASSKGRKVTIDNIDEPFYNKRFIGAKRLVEKPQAEPAPVEEKQPSEPAGESAG